MKIAFGFKILNFQLLDYAFILKRKIKVNKASVNSIRAVSGISGSRLPDNRLGYPNANLGSGNRNVALWEELKNDFCF